MRVSGVLNVRIVLKFANDVTVTPSALHFSNLAVFQMNFDTRPKTAGAVGAGDDAVGLGVGETVDPFGVVFGIVIEVLAVLAGARIWIHEQVTKPVDTA